MRGGTDLVSDEKIQNSRKITREFEVQPGGERLYETLRIDSSARDREWTIRHAYDIIPTPNNGLGGRRCRSPSILFYG